MLSKEQIKDQMLRTAARIWQIPEEELEHSYDPLMMLLLEACATELEHINHDIKSAQGRLLERLAAAVLPDAITGARPAIAVLQATPAEPAAVLGRTHHFAVSALAGDAPEGGGGRQSDLFFTPAGDFPVHAARLQFMIAGGKVWRFTANGGKEPVSGKEGNAAPADELWLALHTGKGVKDLQHLSLFFDLRQRSEANDFYAALPLAKAFYGDAPVSLAPGYATAQQFEYQAATMLSDGNDYTQKLERQAAAHFARQFLHISGPLLPGQVTAALPEALTRLDAPAVQVLSAAPLLYLRVQLSRHFDPALWDGLTVAVNAMPVLNRRLRQTMYRTDDRVNIISLQTEAPLLDLHSITSAGGEYRFRTGGGAEQLDAGEAILRTTGAGRESGSALRNSITGLMESVRNESAFFTDVSNDFIQARLREVSQILTRIEDAMVRATDREAQRHYLLLRARKAGDTVSVKFWTTDAATANELRGFSVLAAAGHSLVASKDAVLITKPQGGRGSVPDAEKTMLLRRQLEGRGRIVSAGDIKMLCREVLGASLTNVTVQRGVAVGQGPSAGFSRVIDVVLQVAEAHTEDARSTLSYQVRRLEELLEEDASPACRFRIQIR